MKKTNAERCKLKRPVNAEKLRKNFTKIQKSNADYCRDRRKKLKLKKLNNTSVLMKKTNPERCKLKRQLKSKK